MHYGIDLFNPSKAVRYGARWGVKLLAFGPAPELTRYSHSQLIKISMCVYLQHASSLGVVVGLQNVSLELLDRTKRSDVAVTIRPAVCFGLWVGLS